MSEEKKLLMLLIKKWKFILISLIIFGVLTTVVTFFIPSKYRSTAIVYPTKSNSLIDAFSNPEFGFDIHADRLIQVFQSQIIQDSLVKKFNLINYYELDTNSADWYDQLNRKLAKDVVFTRTRYMSVVITVTTKSPQMSKDMADYLLNIINKVNENILKENTIDAAKLYKDKYMNQKAIEDSLLNLIYAAQNNGLSSNDKDILLKRRQAEIIDNNNKGNYTVVDNVIKRISTSDKELEITINNYYYQRDRSIFFRDQYLRALDLLSTPTSKVYLISKPMVNGKRVSPSLTINLLLGLGLGFLVSVFLILLQSKTSEIKANL
jgi:capsular polysaccharide biosynthesis protein